MKKARSIGAMALACAGAVAQEPARTPLPPPAVPIEKAQKPVASISLVNAGFESPEPGKLAAPHGWSTVQHAGPESYRFSLDGAQPKSGRQSLRIENVGPEPFGTVYQSIDATPYRGKTLRFAAWLRTEGTTGNRFASGAGLHLQSQRGASVRDTAPMRRNAVHGSTGWTRYEVVLTVADDVDRVEVGLNLFGPGIAWIDDAALDVIEPPTAAVTPKS